MSQWWMTTGPVMPGFKRLLRSLVSEYDIHEWAYCIEESSRGYRHAHVKLKGSSSMSLGNIQSYLWNHHIEISNDDLHYLRKEGGIFVSSKDPTPVRAVRFGQPRLWQVSLIERARQQSDRQITVLVDEEGALGKSWLAAHLIENNQAYFVPPTISDTKDMIQYIASGYDYEEFIIIDIPRSWKWTEKIATVVETVKDGFVYDTRYSAKWKHIRGVKVIVFTNVTPPTKALSPDRWDIIDGRLYRNTTTTVTQISPPLGGEQYKGGARGPPPNTPSRDGGVSPPPGPSLRVDKPRSREMLVNELRAKITHVTRLMQ